MKKISLSIIALFIALTSFGQAKYVFMFIGDGMGANQVNATEMYLNALDGRLGCGQLCFTQFPVASICTTYSADDDVTDSAASGTALATGTKTNNGYLGVDPQGNKLISVARLAKSKGKKVGILTTVGINHATPGAYYAGRMSRSSYDSIMLDLAASKFDFFGGQSYLRTKMKADEEGEQQRCFEDARILAEGAGYTCVESIGEFKEKYAGASKMIIVPESENCIPRAIDRINATPDQAAKYISLRELLESAVTFLTKDNKNPGFFIMAEGGQIDQTAHGNDAASDIQEIIDFDRAIRFAYEFYLRHPKETAIIITADHDTGGMTILVDDASQLSQLRYQRESEGAITDNLLSMMESKGKERLSWDEVKGFLSEHFGLWTDVEVSPDDELKLFTIYTNTIAKAKAGDESDEYGYNHDASIVSAAVDYLDNASGIHYATGGHSAGYVPVYAIGVGAEKFSVKNDNIDIFRKVREIGKY